jgi:hypothetical protein
MPTIRALVQASIDGDQRRGASAAADQQAVGRGLTVGAVYRDSSRNERGDTMTEDWPPAVRPDGTAAPPDGGRAACGTGRERAAIVVVSRDAGVRKALDEELSGRYGADYRIVVCDEPAMLEPVTRELLAVGTPVAMVVGAVGETDPDGIEVLARVRGIDRTVSSVAAVRWGEWDAARPVFNAVTMGKIDHWVTRPVQSPDEEFHQSITQFLGEWSSRHADCFEPVQIIGEHWSARS